jgi:nicotinamide-nucleotide amidase
VFAEVLTIGDELCRGEIVDTNSSWLAERLWSLGVTVRWMTSCRDDAADLERALRDAASRADVVLTSGGLGPTEDDLTVDVVCAITGVEAEIDEASRDRMAVRFAGRIAITPTQLRQVRVPRGARVHGNPGGLAPCFETAIGGVPVVCMPGIPREIHAIWDGGLEARVIAMRGDAPPLARRIYRVFGQGESQISQACRGVVDGVDGASIHYQVKFPETLVKIVVRGAGAADRLADVDRSLRERLGAFLYGDGEPALPERVCAELREAGLTVATAESCTGGLVGEILTRHGGSSIYYMGGAITYSNDEKVRQLGVRRETLDRVGAVSEDVVREMVAGAIDRFGVDLAIAVSGIAGPDGGTPEKPVGTVWIAVGRRGRETSTKRLGWPGPRDMIRTLAAWWSMAMLREAMTS